MEGDTTEMVLKNEGDCLPITEQVEVNTMCTYIIDSYDKEEDAFADFYQYVLSQIKAESL